MNHKEPEINKDSFRLRPLEERRKKYESLLKKSADSIPIVFEADSKTDLPMNLKLSAKKGLKFSKIVENYRSNGKIEPSKSIFFYSETSKTISHNLTIDEIYSKYKNKEDNFLYIKCAEVEALGCDY